MHVVRILVVDDNEHVRTALRICLQLNGWKVCGEAADGQAAISLVRTTRPDIVLLDYAMPVMNGVETARAISLVDPNCPMLMFTMFASNQLIRIARSAGIRTVVSKGVGGMKALVEEITRIVSSASPVQRSPECGPSALS